MSMIKAALIASSLVAVQSISLPSLSGGGSADRSSSPPPSPSPSPSCPPPPKDMRPTRDASGRLVLPKGAPLDPSNTVAVIIDMQPLFYDARSPWGDKDGLSASDMDDIYANQLQFGHQLGNWSDKGASSVFLTKYIPALNASVAPGAFRSYFEDNEGITKDALLANGLSEQDVDDLYDVMPQLHDLIDAGAQVAKKDGASAFAVGSELPPLLDTWFGEDNSERTLILAGVQTSYCVLGTAMSAIDRYYRVLLVTDAIGMGAKTPEFAAMQTATLDCILPQWHDMVTYVTTAELEELLQ